MLDQDLLDILACPACRAGLRLEGDRLVCTGAATGCGLRFPIRDGIPILLVDEADRTDASGAERAGRAEKTGMSGAKRAEGSE